MITCHKKHLLARCDERGYILDEVMPCVVSQDGDQWTVDVDHPAYPKIPQDKRGIELGSGPGTEMKALLSKIGITASATCSCNARAKAMDEKGIPWCEENVETICDWLQEEATKRKLPFVRLAGKALIHMAIRRAKKGTNK